MAGEATYLGALYDAVEQRSDQPLLTFLPDGTGDGVTWTYADLHRHAGRVAGQLAAAAPSGTRVLLMAPPGLAYVAGFFGCLYAGMIAVPAYPPSPVHGRDGLDRLHAVAADAGVGLGLTTRETMPLVASLAIGGRRVRWVLADDEDASGAEVRAPDLDPSAVAFLQYTSGSTADPKGVMVTQGNLLANSSMIGKIYGGRPGARLVSWLPPYHDMGLIGMLLTPPVLGMHAIFMPPTVFLRRPVRWLQALSRFHGAYAGAPNFGYEACTAKVTDEELAGLDLSAWDVAISGAEPVRAATLERFTARFAPAGFRRDSFCPSYGLAEVTLMATAGTLGQDASVVDVDATALGLGRLERSDVPGAVRLVTCGRPADGTSLRIVDPETGGVLRPGQIGEIVVEGAHVAAGYWARPDATAELFPGGAVRTGDLGCVLDGELVVTGRIKDLLVLRGRNHYPHDIELTAEAAHPALRRGCAAAVSVEHGNREQLVLVLEATPAGLEDPTAVVDRVRHAVTLGHAVTPDAVVLVRPGGVPKTSSGKVRRSETRRLFHEAVLASVWEWRSNSLDGYATVGDRGDVGVV